MLAVPLMTLFSFKNSSYCAKANGSNWEFGINAMVFFPVKGFDAQDTLNKKTRNVKILFFIFDLDFKY